MDVLDIIALDTPICVCCIRLVNLINSQPIGKTTDASLGKLDNSSCSPGQ